MRFLFALLLLAVVPPSFAEDKPHRIGVIASLTGIASEYGKTIRQAAALAADDANAQGGPRIEVLLEDDHTDSKLAVSAYEKLKAAGVEAMIVGTWDFTANPLFPLAARDRMAVIATAVPPEGLDLARGGEFAFVNVFSMASEAQTLARYLRQYPATRVAFVYANNRWGESQLGVYRKVAVDAGLSVVAEIKPSAYDDNEWNAIVPRIRAASPDLVALLLNKNDIALAMRRLSEQHVDARVFSSINGFDIWREDKSNPLFEGLCFAYPSKSLRAHPEFVRRYRERFGEEPRIYADLTYDAVFMLKEALSHRGGGTVAEAMRRISIDGLAGHYTYSSQSSFSSQAPVLNCIHHGELEIIG